MSDVSGKKFDNEKTDMDLLSPYALEKIAQVMTYGKQKYGRDNWRGGIVYSRLLAAVMRHINAYRKGETLDPETGLSHLSHASCGLMMLLEFEETRPDLDDRFILTQEANKSSSDLYNEAEKAQAQIKKMVSENKRNIFEKTIKESDLYVTAKKHTFQFEVGESVIHTHNDGPEVTVYGHFYDENFKPIMLVRDYNGKVFQVDPNFYTLAPIVAVDENGTISKYTRNGLASRFNPKGIPDEGN